MKYLLRIEGVNLGKFVFNTRDLSTIRGSGLMQLEAVEAARKALERPDVGAKVTVLSKGASSGLFQLETDKPEVAADAVRDELSKHPDYALATFVVDIVEKSPESPLNDQKTFRTDVESLMAANRWRQMQASSLAIPEKNQSNANMPKPACALDGVSAASLNCPAPNRGKDSFVCESVHHRREYGRKQKQLFYKEIVGRVASSITGERKTAWCKLQDEMPQFAEEFEDIANNDRSDEALGGKIAVFYADGNNFGKIQRTYCKESNRQNAFDQYLREQRESFLADFLNSESAKSEWLIEDKETGKKTMRFETLLWGGDEVMFVMPATLGWRFAQFFFEKMGGLNLNQAKLEERKLFPENVPLSHAASLVFCQHHAPIYRIKHLLKDQVVDGFSKDKNRESDSLVVVALESFDHLGTSYENAMNGRYNGVVNLEQLILQGQENKPLDKLLSAIADNMSRLRSSPKFARSQLHGIVCDMLADPGNANALASFHPGEKPGEWKPPHAFRNAGPDDITVLHDTLLPLFEHKKYENPQSVLWIQLEELWDYALL